MSLDGFTESTFTHGGATRVVYRRGSGPGVVVVHEIPGIIPQVADFGRRDANVGLTAVLPVMFGTPGKAFSTGYMLQQVALACVRREFTTFALGRSSPITDWLRALFLPNTPGCKSGTAVDIMTVWQPGTSSASEAASRRRPSL
jgi:dienelactone hydrolase